MQPPIDPDAALMLRVQRGDRLAFTELVEKHRQSVMNFVARMLRDPVEAEDIAQATFVQVFKCAKSYRPSARFTTWLFTISRNLCLNEIRRRVRHPAEPLDLTVRDQDDQPRRQFKDGRAAAPSDEVLHGELLTMIENALASLPETQRTALLLCREGELSYEEIAAVLGCSVSATKSIIHRAREVMRRVLKPYLLTGVWLGEVSQL